MKTINGLRICKIEFKDITLKHGDCEYSKGYQCEAVRLDNGSYLFVKGGSYSWIYSDSATELEQVNIDDRKTVSILDAIGCKPKSISMEFYE